ncbi:hypothetical protein Mx8p80 [Myxococcus phage Mx8]|uniref:p80 n=1 Tax=Myxococcus phage Mx8 TaxID=49964 RepID=Q94MN9_9CAUD|nr:hypothetical protein Mx8p80 [Myxococcus phage Mx8]AAK94415.1 p80 [Myxococcus phage Mx8]
MPTNRAVVAVSENDTWLFLAVKGRDVEHEAKEVDPELEHLDGFTALGDGLWVLDFEVHYSTRPPDHCDVTAHSVTSRRPTADELAAISSGSFGQLKLLWDDVEEG